MKTWLTKFRISNALDTGKPLPPSVQRAVAQSEELRRFAKTAAELDQSLKNPRPMPEAPASLHIAIMRAVRVAEPEPVFNLQTFWPRLIPTAVIASLVLLGVLGVSHFFRPTRAVSQPGEPSSVATASSALEMSNKLLRELPENALAPLNNEMLRLNRDLANAQKFLLASLP